MMQASFARMCCRGAVEDQGELAGALEEFLARWLRECPPRHLRIVLDRRADQKSIHDA